MKNILYYKVFYEIGGTESFIYYLCKKYKNKDITVYYRDGDPKQLARLRRLVRVKKYEGEEIECDNAFFNYHYDIIDHVHAKQYIQVLHTDYSKQNVPFTRCAKMTKYLGVSKAVATNFTKMTGLPCEVAYNPIDVDKPRKVLRLISATRLSAEKGFQRMVTLCNALKKSGIPYEWIVFTNDTSREGIEGIGDDSFIFKNPVLNITDYIADADYLVQLSNNRRTDFGYTPCEALCLGIPVIVTPCDSFKELGIVDGENGYVLDFDMNNIDIDKIYKKRPTFKYEPPKDIYGDLLKGKSTYDFTQEDYELVQCINTYSDSVLGELKTEMSPPYLVTKARAKVLSDMGYAKIL